MLDEFRNRRIKKIFEGFPIVSNDDENWLIDDLRDRSEKLSMSLQFMSVADERPLLDRIQLINDAIEIMSKGSYRDLNNSAIVRRVYAHILR
ncbi:hypothetical protein ABHN11_24740 [Brevibacillus centrosporus]|uniref:hypothetical protein n=1 Tax=Brevibacillus centrosporus TaxID=54910 RepID=UPI003D209CD9